MILLTGLLYLLSFGPVERYCCTVTSQSSPPATFMEDGQTVFRSEVRSVRYRYPRWVGIIYYPAFLLKSTRGENGLYGSYLHWWENRASQK